METSVLILILIENSPFIFALHFMAYSSSVVYITSNPYVSTGTIRTSVMGTLSERIPRDRIYLHLDKQGLIMDIHYGKS